MSQDGSESPSATGRRTICSVKLCPQLEIIETPLGDNQGHTQFRVFNWRTLSSGRTVRGDGTSLLEPLVIGALIFFLWRSGEWRSLQWRAWLEDWRLCLAVVAPLAMLYSKCRTVLYESIEPLPGLGLQVSTTRGVSLPHPQLLLGSKPPRSRLLLPLSTSRRFIPLSTISTVIINERLTRWSVRYYLAVVLREGEGVVVLLDNMRQNVEVMKEIYYGIREILFDDYEDDDEAADLGEAADVGLPNGTAAGGSEARRRRSKKKRK